MSGRGHRFAGASRHVAVLALYLAVAAVLYSRAWAHLGSQVVGGRDVNQFAWFLAWDWYAIVHGTLPFFSDRVAVPHGVNVMWNTSIPLWGVLLGPLTAGAGPATATVVAGTIGMALSGYTAFLLARDWSGTWIGPVVCGLLFQLCPFVYVHAQFSHLNFVLGVAWLPLLALLTARLAQARGDAVRTGVLLGLCLTGELLTAEELIAICAIGFAAALIVAGVIYREYVAARLRHFLLGSGVAVAVFAVLGALPLTAQLTGPQGLDGRDIQGDFGGAAFYSLDLANIVVPTNFIRFVPGFWSSTWRQFTGTNAEQTGYLGIVILLAIAVYAVALRRQRMTWWVLTSGAAALVLALGSHVHVLGAVVPHVPAPMRVLGGLPMLQNLMPVRFTVLVSLAAALAVSRLVDAIWQMSAGRRLVRASGLAVAAVCLASLLPAGRLTTIEVRAQPYLARMVPPDATVAVFPYPGPDNPETMYWSAASGVRYKFVGGALTVPDPNRLGHALFGPLSVDRVFWNSLLQSASSDRPLDDSLVEAERAELHSYGVQYVVLALDDDLPAVDNSRLHAVARREITRTLGVPPREEGDALVWTVARSS